MTQYKSFLHVERLGTEETEGILDGTCYLSPKVDGTNALIWCQDGEICAGSRTRQLSAEKDNAGFYAWTQSDDEEAVLLREMLYTNQHLIVYGEFGVGKVAEIKYYDKKAHDKLWIFDMYDTIAETYVHPETVYNICYKFGLDQWRIPYLKFDNPDMETVIDFAKDNRYLLFDADRAGEGVVVRNPQFINRYGRYCIGKFVLDEYKQSKSKPKEKIDSKRVGCEQNIIDYYVTDAELTKAKHKTCVAFGVEEFKKEGKFIGMYLNIVFKDAVLAEMSDICKRYKRPIINFQELNNLCNEKARAYINL